MFKQVHRDETNAASVRTGMKRNAVVFVGHCFPIGLVYHLTYMACNLYETYNNHEKIDFYLLSSDNESYKGSWQLIYDTIPQEKILITSDYFESVQERIIHLYDFYEKVQVHFGGGYNQLRPLIRVKRRFRKRLLLIATTHSYRHDSWLRPFVSLLQCCLYLKYTDYVIFQCPYAARRFLGSGFLFARGRAGVIPLGVEDFTISMGKRPEKSVGNPDIREQISNPGWFNVVYLAQLRPGKRHQWLVNALQPLLEQEPRLRIWFLGQGPLKNTLHACVEQMGLSEQVLFPGRIERAVVPWVLSHCQCALVPSRAETFGHCYVEPMMAGLPVIGTRVGVAEYLIQDFHTGIGFEHDDPAMLRKALRFLMENPDSALQMGTAAQESVKQMYSHQKIAHAHSSLYNSMFRKA
jgi:glycosyltransferase involved in cell wall biosynthesis